MRFETTVKGVGEPSFVLLHGLGATRRVFDLLIPYLAKDHKVIAYDQRGHGESEKPDEGYTLDGFADDLDEILRRHGVSRPVLVGHSFGANVALRHAVSRRNARGLVLIDGGIVEMHAHVSLEEALERNVPQPDDPNEVERWVREGSPLVQNTPQLAEIRQSLFDWSADGLVRKRFTRERHVQLLRSAWAHDVHQDLTEVPCPTVAIVCRISLDKAPYQQWVEQKRRAAARIARLPNVSVRWMDDAVHDVPLQRPRELAAALLEFAQTLDLAA
jgi:pimeloyl-ACP methyl ester carboxylesterase